MFGLNLVEMSEKKPTTVHDKIPEINLSDGSNLDKFLFLFPFSAFIA